MPTVESRPGEGRPQRKSNAGRHAVASLKHRDFRLLVAGQLLAMTGDQMVIVAIAWHTYVLTDSPLAIGFIGLFRAVPFMVLSPIGGMAADLASRKRILLVTLLTLGALTIILAGATATAVVSPWVIYFVAFGSGLAMAFHHPAQQALIPNVVPRNDLPGALILGTLVRRVATIAGPGFGGLIVGQVGLSATYIVAAMAFVAAAAGTLLMATDRQARHDTASRWTLLVGGLRYARQRPLILSALALDFFVTIVASTRSLLPIFARDVLVVGAEGLGVLHAAISVGAVVGGILLGSVRISHPTRWMLLAAALQGMFLIGFGISPSFPLSVVMLAAMGAANVVAEVSRATIVQLKTPDELRGRVMALSSMFTAGGPQLGQLPSGALASVVGPIGAAVIGGGATILVVAAFAQSPPFRASLRERIEALQADTPNGGG